MATLPASVFIRLLNLPQSPRDTILAVVAGECPCCKEVDGVMYYCDLGVNHDRYVAASESYHNAMMPNGSILEW